MYNINISILVFTVYSHFSLINKLNINNNLFTFLDNLMQKLWQHIFLKDLADRSRRSNGLQGISAMFKRLSACYKLY